LMPVNFLYSLVFSHIYIFLFGFVDSRKTKRARDSAYFAYMIIPYPYCPQLFPDDGESSINALFTPL
ncbi:TPA: hypothetical protein ACNEZE_004112, partial [Escherichia coli]